MHTHTHQRARVRVRVWVRVGVRVLHCTHACTHITHIHIYTCICISHMHMHLHIILHTYTYTGLRHPPRSSPPKRWAPCTLCPRCKFACYMWEGYRRHTGPVSSLSGSHRRALSIAWRSDNLNSHYLLIIAWVCIGVYKERNLKLTIISCVIFMSMDLCV